MSLQYQKQKASIYKYREKNADKIKDKLKQYYIYKKELQEFMNILLEPEERIHRPKVYYDEHKEEISKQKKEYYIKKKLQKSLNV